MQKAEAREKIFAPRTNPTEEIEICGAKGILHKAEWFEMQEAGRASIVDSEIGFDRDRYLIAIAILTFKDEQGEPIFERSDFESLLHLPGDEMGKLVTGLLKLNGMITEEVLKRVKASAGTGAVGRSSPFAGSSASFPASSTDGPNTVSKSTGLPDGSLASSGAFES